MFPYDFALAVLFRCPTAFCALRNVGVFSHGLDRCTISFRLAVISLADNGCVRGMPYERTRNEFRVKVARDDSFWGQGTIRVW